MTPAPDVETASLQYEPHELDAAPSPLLRFLPVYERDFRGHLLRARSLWDASQTRLRDAEQLLSEMVCTRAGAAVKGQTWAWVALQPRSRRWSMR